MNKIFDEIKAERARQNEKWGIQHHNLVEWIAILGEEFGEVSKEAVDWHFANGKVNINDDPGKELQNKRLDDYRTECIQVAAVATQMIEDLDRSRKLTCFSCSERDRCKFAFDPYNTNGDCLMMK